jgi:hypothetical protein
MFFQAITRIYPYSFYLLLLALALNNYAQYAAAVAVERLNSPPELSTGRTTPAVSERNATDIAERQAPTIIWDTEIGLKWTGVIRGVTRCNTNPETWSGFVMQDAYPKFLALGGKKLLVTFCVFKGYCTAASIPIHFGATQFITGQMDNVPEWN